MIPSGRKRLPLEAPLMRVVATGGIFGIGVVIAAMMTLQDSQGPSSSGPRGDFERHPRRPRVPHPHLRAGWP
jgi:hypothetical protein